MCLLKVKKQGLDLSGIGYKVLQRQGEELHQSFYGVKGDSEYKIELNTKYTAFEREIWDDQVVGSKKYTTGFHIFTSIEDARMLLWRESVIVKVDYIGGHTVGTEPSALNDVVVARHITFLEVVEEQH